MDFQQSSQLSAISFHNFSVKPMGVSAQIWARGCLGVSGHSARPSDPARALAGRAAVGNSWQLLTLHHYRMQCRIQQPPCGEPEGCMAAVSASTDHDLHGSHIILSQNWSGSGYIMCHLSSLLTTFWLRTFFGWTNRARISLTVFLPPGTAIDGGTEYTFLDDKGK